jgi:hypothetical protein
MQISGRILNIGLYKVIYGIEFGVVQGSPP